MRTKKKILTNKPEVEVKEIKALEETITKETEEIKPEQKEEVKEEIQEVEKIEENKEEKTTSRKRGKISASKETVSGEEEPKRRGRKVGTKAEEKKITEKKTIAKKTAEAVTEEKVVLQFAGKEISTNDIINQVKAIWVEEGHRVASIKKLELYIKPEDFAAYYVINEKNNGKIDL